MIHRPEIKDGDILTAETFNNIYDAIQEVEEYSYVSKFELEQKITKLLKQEEKNCKTIKTLWLLLGIFGIVIIILLLVIIFGVL